VYSYYRSTPLKVEPSAGSSEQQQIKGNMMKSNVQLDDDDDDAIRDTFDSVLETRQTLDAGQLGNSSTTAASAGLGSGLTSTNSLILIAAGAIALAVRCLPPPPLCTPVVGRCVRNTQRQYKVDLTCLHIFTYFNVPPRTHIRAHDYADTLLCLPAENEIIQQQRWWWWW
jgi:hypothetical protein